jgi:hypothetical protein
MRLHKYIKPGFLLMSRKIFKIWKKRDFSRFLAGITGQKKEKNVNFYISEPKDENKYL